MTETKEALYAKMYAWLRQQHWSNSPMAVVLNPKNETKLGAYLPSLDRLDEEIMTAMGLDFDKESASLKGTRCKHNVLWPHECKECADEIPLEIIGTWETSQHSDNVAAQERAAAIVAQWPEWKRNYPLTKYGSPALAAHNPELPNNQQGLYQKFLVSRTDGSDQPGGKHHGCTYFVLDLVHDKHAPSALAAYAKSCRETHPQLSADLDMLFSESPPEPETFAVTYIERREGGPMLFRRPLSDWPEWAEPLKKAVEEQSVPPAKKYMPIHSTHLSIPMEMLNEEWAKKNHNQTLDRLAERGGLAACEALDIIKRQRFVYGNTKKNTLEFLEWVIKQTAPVPVSTSERLPTEADADCHKQVWAFVRPCAKWILGGWEQTIYVSVDSRYHYYWLPTGLIRPKIPETGSV